jgi:hypothetical protein
LKSKLWFFFLFLSITSFSQERLNLNYNLRNARTPVISFYVSPFPSEEIVFALERGFQSRFSVELKIKEKLEGLEGLFGDRTHHQENVFLIAEYDPFKEEYNIETYTGGSSPSPDKPFSFPPLAVSTGYGSIYQKESPWISST